MMSCVTTIEQWACVLPPPVTILLTLSMHNRVPWGLSELTQTSRRAIRYPQGELKATLSTGLDVLQCNGAFTSFGRSLVTRGRSVAEYLLLHGPGRLSLPYFAS